MTERPSIRRVAVLGVLVALAVSTVIGVVVFAVGFLVTREVTENSLRAPLYLALGFLTLNLVVLGVGLLARPSESWAIGAAVATPVILAAIGFGYTIFLARPL
jgi:hypothetical protein